MVTCVAGVAQSAVYNLFYVMFTTKNYELR